MNFEYMLLRLTKKKKWKIVNIWSSFLVAWRAGECLPVTQYMPLTKYEPTKFKDVQVMEPQED